MNPQKELYKILAEAQLRSQHIKAMHSDRHRTIPARQQNLLRDVEEMRSQIQATGVGNDHALEDRYLQALRSLERLDNSYEMGKRLLAEDAPQDEALSKMVRLGNLMLSVYGGQLRKSAQATADIQRIGLALQQHQLTKPLGDRLLRL